MTTHFNKKTLQNFEKRYKDGIRKKKRYINGIREQKRQFAVYEMV